jgi:hypothetical protein
MRAFMASAGRRVSNSRVGIARSGKDFANSPAQSAGPTTNPVSRAATHKTASCIKCTRLVIMTGKKPQIGIRNVSNVAASIGGQLECEWYVLPLCAR